MNKRYKKLHLMRKSGKLEEQKQCYCDLFEKKVTSAVYTYKKGGKFNRNLILKNSFSTPPYHHITMHHNTYSA